MQTKISEMETLIRSKVSGTTTVSVDTITEPRMVKKHRGTGEPNPYIGVQKIQTKNGIIGFDYYNSVNNEAGREGLEFRPIQKRAWGELSEDRLFVYHKGTTYLQMKVQSVSGTRYVLDGKEIPASEIEPYLSGYNKSSTQADLEKEVIVNDIKFTSIKAIRMFGEEIEVVA